jgi:hypothetical protein
MGARLELAEDLVGSVGTYTTMGIVSDPNPKRHPYMVRGYSGSYGLYEEVYRGEPLVYDAIQSKVEPLVAGTWELQPPKGAPPEWADRLNDFITFHNARLHGLACGWLRFIEQAGRSVLKNGFAPFGISWGKQGGRTYIYDLGFYEPSIVHEWVWSPDLRTPLEMVCRTSGDSSVSFRVPMAGPRITDVQALVFNIAAEGANIEGVSPLRPVLHYVQHKQLLLQIAAVAAEKFGIPITTIMEDPAWAAMMQGHGEAADAEREDVYEAMRYRTGLDADVITLPAPLTLGVHNPQGQMPSFQEQIDYLDRMILTPFSAEGSLLGHQGVGSYSLGEVAERDELRSAPYYARLIAGPLNRLLAMLWQMEHPGAPIPAPTLMWRMDGLQDNSKWLEDVMKFTAQVGMAPAVRTACLEKLGLPIDAYDEMDREAEERREQMPEPPEPDGEPEDEPVENADAPPPNDGFDPDRARAQMDDAELEVSAVLGKPNATSWGIGT